MRVTNQVIYRAAATAVLLVGVVAGSPVRVGAAPNTQSITISPTSSPVAVNAGKSTSGIIKVIDGGETAVKISIEATPYGVRGEDYEPQFHVTSGFNDASQWFKFAKTTYDLQPHQYQEIPYTLSVPANAGPGGYYATVFAETTPTKATGSGVQTQSRVGSIFYIRVSGSVSEAGSVASWNVPFLQYRSPISTELRLTNAGNVHFQATTDITFHPIVGGHDTVVQDQHYVLPGTTRALPITWKNGPKIGLYKVTGTSSFLHQTQTLPAHYVLALPVIAILLIVAAILAIVSGCVYLISTRRR